MKKDEILQLFEQFEAAAAEVEGVECWSARELAPLFGYAQWRNFQQVIEKAKEACAGVGNNVAYHFADVSKTIPMPKGAQKQIDEVLLTRYACYLIAQNGDPRKPQVAFAQTYFAVQPRISIKAKDFAAEMTSVNVQAKDLRGQTSIEREHVDNTPPSAKCSSSAASFPKTSRPPRM